jgi:hypothetical protein
MTDSAHPLPAEGRIEGRPAFQQAVREALAAAAQGQYRDLVLSDHDFEHWPLGERAVVESFNQWALGSAHGRCVLLGAEFGAFFRAHPRWVEWRQPWSHRVVCLQAPEEFAAGVPSALLVPGAISVELFDPERYRGLISHDPLRWRELQEKIDAISQRSGETFPPTTLGL